MATWQLQEAKARLSEVIQAAKAEGPQTITLRGIETAVIVPIEHWKRVSTQTTSLLSVLRSGPQFDLNIPPRGKIRTGRPLEQ